MEHIMKENLTIPKDHLVEDFVKDLDIQDSPNSVTVTLERESMDRSLVKLTTALTNHDKVNFLNCSIFYENILRQQNNLLYLKEQQMKSCEDKLEQQHKSRPLLRWIAPLPSVVTTCWSRLRPYARE